MSDENLNNNSNDDETMALFVSAQKKKKLEEEAKQKAAEEQARRDAAEAEVRRMELEVEERRRKAEEERRALEAEEAKKKEKRPKPEVKEEKPVEKAGTSVIDKVKQLFTSNPKMKIYAGIGAAAVVAIVVLIIVLCSGSSKIVVDELDFGEKYAVKESAYDFEVAYPKKLFSDVTNAASVVDTDINDMVVHFGGNKTVDMNMAVIPFGIKKNFVSLFGADELEFSLEDAADAIIDEYYKGATKSTGIPVDIYSGTSDKFVYKFDFFTAEGQKGYIIAWLRWNKSDLLDFVCVYGTGKAEDFETTEQLCKRFNKENSANTAVVPGTVSVKQLEADTAIEELEVTPQFSVPSSFFKIDSTEENGSGMVVWGDENGAMIFFRYIDAAANIENESGEAFYTDIASWAEKYGVQSWFSDLITERENVNSSGIAKEGFNAGVVECFELVGGVPYTEKGAYGISYNLSALYDAEAGMTEAGDGMVYYVSYTILAPEKNKLVYTDMFDQVVAEFNASGDELAESLGITE